jgi:hypothetical protein
MSSHPPDPTDFVSSPISANGIEQKQFTKFHTPGGTGFAAEEANALRDRLKFKKVEMSGLNNELNGADRITDGIAIQTKYFSSARETIGAAFDSTTGFYRYAEQMLEVPRDQYEESIAIMQQKILEGKVPGITQPELADGMVKQGSVTYRQARNIARAGNVDSLVFDVQSQAVCSGYLFAISFVIEFAHRKWSGDSVKTALRGALSNGIAAGTKSMITGVTATQILRSDAAAAGTIVVRHGVRLAAKTPFGKIVIEQLATASLKRGVYGAAAVNHVSKLLRSNVITSTIATVVVTAPDVYRASISRSISWKQFGKNLTVNLGGVGGATGGWIGGAAGGAAVGSVVPGIGTAAGGIIGGIVGGLLGGFGGSSLTKAGMDLIVEDDIRRLLKIVEDTADDLAHDYLLTEEELPIFISSVKLKVTKKWLRTLRKREVEGQRDAAIAFAYGELESACESITLKRQKLEVPKAELVSLEIATMVSKSDESRQIDD